MGSGASTARTTLMACTARDAGRASTGARTETAACPATVTPKVADRVGGVRRESKKERGRKGWRERKEKGGEQAAKREVFSSRDN